MSLTPKEIFEEKIISHLKENPDLCKDMQATYQFDISGDQGGHWHITLNGAENHVKEGSAQDPSCIIAISDKDFVSLVEGTLKPQFAFMTGKLKVRGDLSLALKLGSILKA